MRRSYKQLNYGLKCFSACAKIYVSKQLVAGNTVYDVNFCLHNCSLYSGLAFIIKQKKKKQRKKSKYMSTVFICIKSTVQ